ncbi:hypothetical protein MA785_000784 [Vibrio parahaemolyticus]|nr:hypothetical protein [Vibrio parahaemolyticus]EJR2787893.1 hypothetical protein [Vibrio parahaemolyticus]
MSLSSLMVKFSLLSIASSSSYFVVGEQLSESEMFGQLEELLLTDCEADKSCLVIYDEKNDKLVIDKTLEQTYEIQRSGLIELANIMESKQGIKLDKSKIPDSLHGSLSKEVKKLDKEDGEGTFNAEKIAQTFKDLKTETNKLLAKI